MIGWIFALTGLIFVLSLLAVDGSAARENQHILLNTTLPIGVSKEDRVVELVARYKRDYRMLILLSMAVLSPIVLLQAYPSLVILGFFIWIAVVLWVNSRILQRYAGRLAELKRENGWLVGKKHIITIDTEVSMAKKTMPVPAWWLIPSFLMSLIPFIHGMLTARMDILVWVMGLSALGMTLIFAYFHGLSARQRATAYCDDTRINMACNRVSIHMKTLAGAVLAAVNSAGMAMLYWMVATRSGNTAAIISIIAVETLVTIAVIFWAFGRIRSRQSRLLEVAGEPMIVDDDEYWKGGFFYNPQDSRTMVEKRIGYGYTVNMASAKGKAYLYGILGITAVILLVMIIMFAAMDSASFTMTLEGNRAVIDAPMYGYEFYIDEIEDMIMIDTLPDGTRTNGAATSRYLLGNFNLEGYGQSKMYVYQGNPPYLVIRLRDMTVFLNGQTEEQTRSYYEQLSGVMK